MNKLLRYIFKKRHSHFDAAVIIIMSFLAIGGHYTEILVLALPAALVAVFGERYE